MRQTHDWLPLNKGPEGVVLVAEVFFALLLFHQHHQYDFTYFNPIIWDLLTISLREFEVT